MSFSNVKVIIVFLYFLTFLSEQAYSQLFFTQGYVVLISGDTLRGEIREHNNQSVDFRSKSDKLIHKYNPNQLIGYQSSEGYRLAIHLTEADQKAGYFVREQVKGYVSLYSLFKSEGRLTHVIRLPDKTFIPLRGNLALLMLTKNLTECNDPTFSRLVNSQSSYLGNIQFERIVKAYNACVSPSQSVKRAKKQFHYETGLLVGAAQNSWRYFAIKNAYWDPNGVYGPNYTAAFGGFFTIVPRKRLSFSIEVLFSEFSGSRTIALSDPLDPTVQKSRLYSFSESYFAFPITGRYVFSKGSVHWYLKGGIVPTLGTVVKGSFVGTSIDAVIPFRAGIEVGYLAGLGVDVRLGRKRHLYIEARTMPHLVSDGVNQVANSRSLQLMVGIPLLER